MARKRQFPPVVVIFGDEEYQKARALEQTLNRLLPPETDRTLALVVLDGTQTEEQGGPSYAGVMDDLATLPFLSDRRVVVIREADRFISAHREKLEKYLASPAPTGTLILECRSFPKTTRLYKGVSSAGGQVIECRKLTGRALAGFVQEQARALGKRIDPAAATMLCDLIGQEQWALAAEVEKLCLYALERPVITVADVSQLVGQSREEKIFKVMDAAGTGKLPEALQLWRQVLATDPTAIYRAVGGIAFVLRRWLEARRAWDEGTPTRSLAPKLMMWGRERELESLLRRQTPERLQAALAALAETDAQAKSGRRSIEAGVEALLVRVAAPAT